MQTAAETGGAALAGALEGAPVDPSAMAFSEAEFQRIYDTNAGPILGYLAASTGRRDVADDLLQETFCRLLVQAKSGMAADAVRRYLFRIATNLLRDRWRSGEGRAFEEPAEAAVSADPNASIDVRAMLAHLNSRERQLLWLAYVEGMDHAEIAAATGLGRLSVRTLLFRARARAKKFLNAGGELR